MTFPASVLLEIEFISLTGSAVAAEVEPASIGNSLRSVDGGEHSNGLGLRSGENTTLFVEGG